METRAIVAAGHDQTLARHPPRALTIDLDDRVYEIWKASICPVCYVQAKEGSSMGGLLSRAFT